MWSCNLAILCEENWEAAKDFGELWKIGKNSKELQKKASADSQTQQMTRLGLGL